MIQRAKNFFSIKASSLDDFIELVSKNSGSVATGRSHIGPSRLDSVIGILIPFFFPILTGPDVTNHSPRHIPYIELSSDSISGRKINYREACEGISFDAYDFVYGDKGEKHVIQTLLTLDQRLSAVRERLPNVITRLMVIENEMSKERYSELNLRAKEYGLTPFPLTS